MKSGPGAAAPGAASELGRSSAVASSPPPPAPSAPSAAPTVSPRRPQSTARDMGTEPPPGKKTLQRQAVDAMAAGDHERAARLYEELARDQPDVPAYADALRIVRTKAAKRP
ncbi:hypothetical protein ACMHYB_43975 [Sorangium sp. So ce1128]